MTVGQEGARLAWEGEKALKPGMEITITGCIPACGEDSVDLYLVCFAPSGEPYSIVYPGYVMEGVVRYASAIYNPSGCLCAPMFSHTICQDAQPGVYTMVLAVFPYGAKVDVRNIMTYAVQKVIVTE